MRYHLSNGFFFERVDNETVELSVDRGEHQRVDRWVTLRVPVNEWASAIAATTLLGENAQTYDEALGLLNHRGGGLPDAITGHVPHNHEPVPDCPGCEPRQQFYRACGAVGPEGSRVSVEVKLEKAIDALRLIQDNGFGESYSAGVAMSCLASIDEKLGECYWHPGTRYDMGTVLCGDDGIVRPGQLVDGQYVPYPCTGGAHYGGLHIRCLSPSHQKSMLPPA